MCVLPANINILVAEKTHAAFHARHDATQRSYVYVISKKRTAFGKKYVWLVRDNLDFASFADKRLDKGVSTLVQIDSLELHQTEDLFVFRIAGSHFLWKMVRRMVGIMVEAGRGNLAQKDVENMLKRVSDVPARYTAPPSGLFLEQVNYAGDRPQPRKLPFFVALQQTNNK